MENFLKQIDVKDLALIQDAHKEITFVNHAGVTVNAKDIFCKYSIYLLDCLAAAQALINNGIVKMLIGLVMSAVQALITAICPK